MNRAALVLIKGVLLCHRTVLILPASTPHLMRLRSFVGVAVGGVLDVGTSILLSVPLFILLAATQDFSRVPPEEAGLAMVAALDGSPPLQVAMWMLGLAATTLGGYTAAVIARHPHVLHGALSAWLCMGLGVHALVSGADGVAPWQHVLALVLAPAFGALGGYGRLRQERGRGAANGSPRLAAC